MNIFPFCFLPSKTTPSLFSSFFQRVLPPPTVVAPPTPKQSTGLHKPPPSRCPANRSPLYNRSPAHTKTVHQTPQTTPQPAPPFKACVLLLPSNSHLKPSQRDIAGLRGRHSDGHKIFFISFTLLPYFLIYLNFHICNSFDFMIFKIYDFNLN